MRPTSRAASTTGRASGRALHCDRRFAPVIRLEFREPAHPSCRKGKRRVEKDNAALQCTEPDCTRRAPFRRNRRLQGNRRLPSRSGIACTGLIRRVCKDVYTCRLVLRCSVLAWTVWCAILNGQRQVTWRYATQRRTCSQPRILYSSCAATTNSLPNHAVLRAYSGSRSAQAIAGALHL